MDETINLNLNLSPRQAAALLHAMCIQVDDGFSSPEEAEVAKSTISRLETAILEKIPMPGDILYRWMLQNSPFHE